MLVHEQPNGRFGSDYSNLESVPDELVMRQYRDAKEFLLDFGLELTPAEAVFLRKEIRDVLFNNGKIKDEHEFNEIGIHAPYTEAISRMLNVLYGIDTQAFYLAYGSKKFPELMRLVKEKYRPEREKI